MGEGLTGRTPYSLLRPYEPRRGEGAGVGFRECGRAGGTGDWGRRVACLDGTVGGAAVRISSVIRCVVVVVSGSGRS